VVRGGGGEREGQGSGRETNASVGWGDPEKRVEKDDHAMRMTNIDQQECRRGWVGGRGGGGRDVCKET